MTRVEIRARILANGSEWGGFVEEAIRQLEVEANEPKSWWKWIWFGSKPE